MPQIQTKNIWSSSRVLWTILSHTPTLDPLTIVSNSTMLCIQQDGEIASFAAIKKYGKTYELGTVYTYPTYRGKGYARLLIRHAVIQYQPIGLLCKKEMISFYEKYGFVQGDNELFRLRIRKKLFNIFLGPILGYAIVSMLYKIK